MKIGFLKKSSLNIFMFWKQEMLQANLKGLKKDFVVWQK